MSACIFAEKLGGSAVAKRENVILHTAWFKERREMNTKDTYLFLSPKFFDRLRTSYKGASTFTAESSSSVQTFPVNTGDYPVMPLSFCCFQLSGN